MPSNEQDAFVARLKRDLILAALKQSIQQQSAMESGPEFTESSAPEFTERTQERAPAFTERTQERAPSFTERTRPLNPGIMEGPPEQNGPRYGTHGKMNPQTRPPQPRPTMLNPEVNDPMEEQAFGRYNVKMAALDAKQAVDKSRDLTPQEIAKEIAARAAKAKMMAAVKAAVSGANDQGVRAVNRSMSQGMPDRLRGMNEAGKAYVYMHPNETQNWQDDAERLVTEDDIARSYPNSGFAKKQQKQSTIQDATVPVRRRSPNGPSWDDPR